MRHPRATVSNGLKQQIAARIGATAGQNHLGEKEQNTYAGWKAACKKAVPGAKVWFDGDKDIGQAMVGEEPYKNGHTVSIGEWDGEKGSVFNDAADRVASLTKSPPDIKPVTKDEAKASLAALRDETVAEVIKVAGALGLPGTMVDIPTQTITVGSGRIKVRVLSHMRLHMDDVEVASAEGESRKQVMARITSHFTPEVLAKIVLADAASRLLLMAGPLDDAAKDQLGRMLDSVELQISLELDRLERENDQQGGNNAEIEQTVNLLDTIMRADTQERLDAVVELFNTEKSLNMITAAHLIRVLKSVHDTIKSNP